MALNDIRGFMAKKLRPKANDEEKVDLEVESWQWETRSSHFNWKHGLALAVLLAVALLFAFGFLIIAGVVLILGIIFNLVLFFFKKLP